jgi:hypothetical protein
MIWVREKLRFSEGNGRYVFSIFFRPYSTPHSNPKPKWLQILPIVLTN